MTKKITDGSSAETVNNGAWSQVANEITDLRWAQHLLGGSPKPDLELPLNELKQQILPNLEITNDF